VTAPTTSSQLARWASALQSGDQYQIAQLSREIAVASSMINTDFTFTIYDKLWVRQGDFTGHLIEGSGTDPRNMVPTGKLILKGDSTFTEAFSQCRNTMVGVTVETAGQRYPFYVKTFTEKYEKSAWTGEVELKGIWDILNYLVIWPDFFLPIQAQPISYAVFMWALCTVLESMVSECALRIQSGLFEFINNALSLDPDIRAWFGTLLQSNGNIFQALKTPVYVKRTNPFLDTSPLVARTVRMETCGAVIGDITRAYGVDTNMDLWLPGDPQPDEWANLTQPTYVFSTVDRSQITGPFGNVLDSVLRTVVDLQGSILGNTLDPFLNPSGPNPALPDGAYEAEAVGIDFVAPYAIVIAPDDGDDGAIVSCEIGHHTPEGWQHIIGGRSPKWVGAPRLTAGGHRPAGLLLTQRPDERHQRVADRQSLNCVGVHRNPLGPAFGVPQQRLLRIPADRALRPPQQRRPLPPRRRNVHRDSVGPLQRRDDLRVHQQAVGHEGLQRGHRPHRRVRPERAIRAWARHLQGRLDVSGVPWAQVHAHGLRRERPLED
jgi:hypothetical protein